VTLLSAEVLDAEPLPAVNPDPVRRPVMTQRWDDVVFLHWPYDPAEVQALLPPGVEVETHGGSAWVGLIGFRMEQLGFPGLAPLPLVGSFPEVNVRTYVRSGNRRGVWFFSLDIDRWLPTAVARLAYRLPYCTGRTVHQRAGSTVVTSVERRWPRTDGAARTELAIRTGPPAQVDDLTAFLTNRWGLIAQGRGNRLYHGAVDHPVWPLHQGEVVDLDDRLVAAAGLRQPVGDPHVVWSPGVAVRIGRPRRHRPA